MSDPAAAPVRKRFFTSGTLILAAFASIGLAFGLARLANGLDTATNLDDFYPWGIWIAIDVACGVALAAGGFTTAALVDIFGRKRFSRLLRPAVLTAWLGYFMVAVGLMFDLGRYWNIWRPLLHWQGNSVLFEVGMCVMAYLAVLTVEMSPALLEGLQSRLRTGGRFASALRRLERPIGLVHSWVKVILPIFIVAGVVLSSMHQSSLGTLMVIAPTKLSPFWYTPLLPLLFLLSAMMVGFPMVIIESIVAHRSFDRDSEVGLLGSLARFIPWAIGAYGLLKLGDLAVRWKQLDFTARPGATISWAVEIVAGLVIPFVLFSQKSFRRSSGWLLFSSILVVFGVVLNRLNVYLIGYRPPYATGSYFPAIGEIALTVGLACLLMLLYRFFATFFPILGPAAPGEQAKAAPHRHHFPAVKPAIAWAFRASAVAFLLGFVILYSLVHSRAIYASMTTAREVALAKTAPAPSIDTSAFRHAGRPESYSNLYFLSSPVLNAKTDYYEPVRFTHRTHDVNADSDCSVCHHRYALGDDDRVGQDLKTMHEEMMEVRITGASCLSCHEDLTEKPQQKCSHCHIDSNEPDYPARIGLKGAYHRQCIGCHQNQPRTAQAPTDCVGCHHPLVPDHTKLIDAGLKLDRTTATAACLECHSDTGREILRTAHWTWQGRTPGISGREHSTTVGLRNTLDNSDISLVPNPKLTSLFHIGDVARPEDWSNPAKIDCLVCHAASPAYSRDPEAGAFDWRAVASMVSRPSRANCGSCHFTSAGGPGAKSGDLTPALIAPSAEADVHMGKVDMRCQDCHTTRLHQIAGLAFNAPVVEERTGCQKCHGPEPHGIAGVISRHLDNHVKTVACETCHIPQFAREHPTRLSVDFSKAGPGPTSPPALQFGKPAFDPRFGEQTWARNVVPVYRWFDGTRRNYELGDKIDPSRPIVLNAPLGDKHNSLAKIFPFKVHRAVQPFDRGQNILAAVKFEDGLWKDYDWARAVGEGMKAMGASFSGEVGFVPTEMYSAVHHEVAPAKKSLGCADCHAPQNVACVRCHSGAAGMDRPEHARRVYPETAARFDFEALGYEGDPAVTGGRFFMYLRRGLPPR
jgi:octaheme c-type cytochrome (tetrathionate reductase family)